MNFIGNYINSLFHNIWCRSDKRSGKMNETYFKKESIFIYFICICIYILNLLCSQTIYIGTWYNLGLRLNITIIELIARSSFTRKLYGSAKQVSPLSPKIVTMPPQLIIMNDYEFTHIVWTGFCSFSPFCHLW